MSDSIVVHHPERFCFTIDTDGIESILQYQLHDQHVDFTRTYVPSELRGRGLAEKLVRHGLAWARAEHLSINASCWYVARFLTSEDQL
jgi:predicted GNAT family acetyltransferase